MKTAKNIPGKAKESKTDPYMAIPAVRNTPTEDMNSSPAQSLLGMLTKMQLPMPAEVIKPHKVNTEDVKKRTKKRQQKQAHCYNRKAKDLPPLGEGEAVGMRPFTLNEKS